MSFVEFFKVTRPMCLLVFCPSDRLFEEMIKEWRVNTGVSHRMVERLMSGKQLLETSDKNKVPPLFEKGYFFVYDAKQNKEFVPDGLNRLLQENVCGYYLIRVTDYRKYITYKNQFQGNRHIALESFSIMRKEDFTYFYNEKILKYVMQLKEEGRFEKAQNMLLPEKLLRYIEQDYAMDVEKILLLFDNIRNGAKIENMTDVIDICGVSTRNLDKLLFTILRLPKLTPRTIKPMMRTMVNFGYDFSKQYGFDGVVNILTRNLRNIIEFKYVKVTGQLVGRDITLLDKSHDTKVLKRWLRYDEVIASFSLEYLMLMLSVFEQYKRKHIRTDVEWLNFCYDVMRYKIKLLSSDVEQMEALYNQNKAYKQDWFEYLFKLREREKKAITKGKLAPEEARYLW